MDSYYSTHQEEPILSSLYKLPIIEEMGIKGSCQKYKSFGCINHLDCLNINGDWINKALQLISNLHCEFEEPSEEYKNGIKVMDNNSKSINQLGILLSEYLVRSVINKNIVIIEDDILVNTIQEYNLILDELYYEDNILSTESIKNINIILNCSTFLGCKSIPEILNCYSTIKTT